MVNKKTYELLDADIIEPTNSNCAFPFLSIKKKPLPSENKLKFRMVIDYC